MRNGERYPSEAFHRNPLRRGFTIIELLVVMTVLAVLASLVVPRYMDKVDTARETVLKQDLQGLRTAIDQFYRDQSRYPESLEELVSKRYIRSIPVDPITELSSSWVPVPPKEGGSGVFDVKSGSPRQARDGSAYASW
ncbi:type II secretion system protein G [Rhodoferax sp. TH121]|uniref:type II secretion system protein n=1 Tax=Rhodoferax sp. TH121 TaxID=2022803 RepID=UPI000B963008|nr:prepilin-type N-terminal cleavage/methylation domain-containing protein [Rhodoferax sp. TH121]OYQ43393.1 type II secretion system protein G [Rhodoferax sp. TH121]